MSISLPIMGVASDAQKNRRSAVLRTHELETKFVRPLRASSSGMTSPKMIDLAECPLPVRIKPYLRLESLRHDRIVPQSFIRRDDTVCSLENEMFDTYLIAPIFARAPSLSGKRLRHLPFTPERVLAALKS